MAKMLYRGVLVMLLLSGVTVGLVAAPAYAGSTPQIAAAAKPDPQDTFYMISQASGKCAEVPGYSSWPGAHVDQYTCIIDWHLNEMWEFKYVGRSGGHGVYNIINAASGLCMNVDRASTANNAAVIQWSCSSTATNTLWYIDEVSGYHVWRNQHSGKCLNVAGGSTSNGTYLIQYTCGNYTNEHWQYKTLCTSLCVRWPWYGW